MLTTGHDDVGLAQDALGERVTCSRPFPGAPPLQMEPASADAFEDIAAVGSWFRASYDTFEDLMDRFGALRWRGFGVRDSRDFEALIDHYPALDQGYTGGSTRRAGIGQSTKVFEATQAAPDVSLGLHQEMAYLPTYPSKLVFFCNEAPDTGGETLVGDMRRFTALLPDRLRSDIEAHGVRYLRNFRSVDAPRAPDAPERIDFIHMAWQNSFATTDRADVDRACASLGLDTRWEPDGSVTTYYTAPGIVTHPRDGGRVSFNMIHTQHAFLTLLGEEWWPACCERYRSGGPPPPYYVEYGNETPIDPADSKLVFDLLADLTLYPAWQRGDVLMVDNLYTAHGRNAFTGTRDVQVALIS